MDEDEELLFEELDAEEVISKVDPLKCKAYGPGLEASTTRKVACFHIQAADSVGAPIADGEAQPFHVHIRGRGRAVELRVRIKNLGNGLHLCEYKPDQSGKYRIAISLGGVALPGSPFEMLASTPTPAAPLCVLRGDALHYATARKEEGFDVSFRDATGQVAHAEDLDVYVVAASAATAVGRDYGTIDEPAGDAASSGRGGGDGGGGASGSGGAGRGGGGDGFGGGSHTESPTPHRPRGERNGGGNADRSKESLAAREAREEAALLARWPVGDASRECTVSSRRPLVLRAQMAIDSEKLGQLSPDAAVRLLEVAITRETSGERVVRARIALVEPVEAGGTAAQPLEGRQLHLNNGDEEGVMIGMGNVGVEDPLRSDGGTRQGLLQRAWTATFSSLPDWLAEDGGGQVRNSSKPPPIKRRPQSSGLELFPRDPTDPFRRDGGASNTHNMSHSASGSNTFSASGSHSGLRTRGSGSERGFASSLGLGSGGSLRDVFTDSSWAAGIEATFSHVGRSLCRAQSQSGRRPSSKGRGGGGVAGQGEAVSLTKAIGRQHSSAGRGGARSVKETGMSALAAAQLAVLATPVAVRGQGAVLASRIAAALRSGELDIASSASMAMSDQSQSQPKRTEEAQDDVQVDVDADPVHSPTSKQQRDPTEDSGMSRSDGHDDGGGVAGERAATPEAENPSGSSATPGRQTPSASSTSMESVGWVTIFKAGRELVTPRGQLHAFDRQRHMQQWARRVAVDKALVAMSDGKYMGRGDHRKKREGGDLSVTNAQTRLDRLKSNSYARQHVSFCPHRRNMWTMASPGSHIPHAPDHRSLPLLTSIAHLSRLSSLSANRRARLHIVTS